MGLDLRHVVPSIKNSEVEELDYFTAEEMNDSPEFLERHKRLIVEIDNEDLKIKVLYFKEKGYQRKGMNPAFNKVFENDKLYFEIESVKRAYQYLKADHIHSLEGGNGPQSR